MNKTTWLGTSCLIVVSVSASAQRIVQGTVTDERHHPIELADIRLLSAKDSTFITGTTTDTKGHFTLNNPPKSPYILKVAALGYTPVYLQKTTTTPIILYSNAAQLKGITVKGRRDILHRAPGRWIANIENSYLADLGNANDVLNQSPLVRDDDGEVNIFGKGTPDIYINNRLISSTNELRQLKSNEIKKIEIVTTPGAEYSSSVRSVIKIYLKPHQGEGLSGNIGANATLYRRFSEYANTHFNYRYRGMDIFFTGDILDSRRNYDSKNRYVTTTITSIYNGKERDGEKAGNLGGGFNYMPNENQSAGFRYNWYRTPTSTTYNHSTVSQSDGAEYTTENQSLTPSYQNYMNAYYSGKFHRFQIDFNTDYSSGKTKEHNATHEQKTENDHLIAYNAGSEYKIAASKLTMTYTRSHYDIVGGGEYNYTTRREGQTILSNTEAGDLPTTNNKINQQLWAAFATCDWQFGQWYFSGASALKIPALITMKRGNASPANPRIIIISSPF